MRPEDREALKWACSAILDDRDHPRDDYSKAAVQVWLQEERWEKALAVVRRLLDNGFLTLSSDDCLALSWARTALEDVPEIRWREPQRADAARSVIDRLLETNNVSVSDFEKPAVVVVFTEGAFEEIYLSHSPKEAQAFASGVVTGAGHYGAGSCATYVLPDEEATMLEHENPNEVAAALERVNALGPLKAVKPQKCDFALDPTSTGTCDRCGFATEDH